MWDKIKSSGMFVFGLTLIPILLGLAILPFLIYGLYIYGIAHFSSWLNLNLINLISWFDVNLMPWLNFISGIASIIAVLVLFPLAFIKRTRNLASNGLLLTSYIFGIDLWVWSLIITNHLWGILAVYIGLLILGVGIIPIAMLAILFNGLWLQLGETIFLSTLIVGVYLLSKYVARKA